MKLEKINDFIQIEAGYDANIIMGVGEDEDLEDEIAVTVVATGFAADQQCEITDTEAKKIIHTLEDEQKAIYSFEEKNTLKEQILNRQEETPVAENKIVHMLGEEEEEVPNAIVKTTSFIQNLDVEYEEIQKNEIEIKAKEEQIKLTSISDTDNFVIEDIVVNEPEVVEDEPVQMDLLFDLPIVDPVEVVAEKPEAPVYFNLDDTTEEFINNIEVNDVEVVTAAEEETIKRYTLEETSEIDVNEIEVNGHIEVKNEEPEIKRYSLTDFEIEPTIKNASTIDVKNINVVDAQEVKETVVEEDEGLVFTVKTTEPIEVENNEEEAKEVSPLDATISEIQKRSHSRREKMKNFNYKFMNNVSQNVDDIEKQPAYKRMGVDLDEIPYIRRKQNPEPH